MSVPGTGSTNQSLTISAYKKLAGKAHTSNLKEFYEETIPSSVQVRTSNIIAEAIPQVVSTTDLYSRFSASASDPYTVEYVEFYVGEIAGTTYDANVGSFGQVGFGGGDEEQSSGVHGYQLVLTSSYESLSSGSWAGSGYFLNNQVVHESNGKLQLINPSFGPQSGNNYGLSLYTDHPSSGGTLIPTTHPMEWSVDYYNGIIFVQDYLGVSLKPKYARGFIYVGKFADQAILDNSGSGGITYSRTSMTSTMTASITDRIIGINASSNIELRLPSAGDYTNGQYFTVKDEGGNSDIYSISILTSGSQTIDGQTSIILESPYAAVNIYSNGLDKFFIY